MEPIIITLYPGGQYKEEKPHEGEEFGYVLAGSIYVHIGEKKNKVKKGESFTLDQKQITIYQTKAKLQQK